MENKAFGIDLGTTYSCISYVDDISGEAVVVDNMEGTNVTPSVVYFEDEETYTVGDVAKESAVISPENTSEFVKRKMGDENSKVAITIGENDYSPEQISSLILTKLVKDAEEALDAKIKDVVITCPAYFGIAERTATENAGKMAGLNVLEIINEPTAAALCYGSLRNVEDKTILVYDLGGGTFDVTIIKVTADEIVAIATDGDHQLGGKNWDEVLMDYLDQEFHSQKTEFDGDFDLEALQELQLKSERAKQQLTAKPSTKVIVSAEGLKASIELTRETFDDITSALLKRTIDKTNDAIAAAKLKGVVDIEEIILVGGSCKMPQVKEILANNYPDIPIKMFDPNEAVAKGAAIHADHLMKGNAKLQKWKSVVEEINKTRSQGEQLTIDDLTNHNLSEETVNELQDKIEEQGEDVQEFTDFLAGKLTGDLDKKSRALKNITSKSFGIRVMVNDTNTATQVFKIDNLVQKQDTVPVSITKEFGTACANMANAEITVYETDIADEEAYDIGDNMELGTAILDLPPNLPGGAPIEVTLKLSTDGLLEIRGFEKTSGNECQATMHSDAILTSEEVEEQINQLKGLTLV